MNKTLYYMPTANRACRNTTAPDDNGPLYYTHPRRRTADERAAVRQARREAEAEQRKIARVLGRVLSPAGWVISLIEASFVEAYGVNAGYIVGFLSGLALCVSGMALTVAGQEIRRPRLRKY